MKALSYKRYSTAKLLLELGANPSIKGFQNVSALTIACLNDDLQAINILLAANKLDINSYADFYGPAIIIATKRRNVGIVKALSNFKGINLNQRWILGRISTSQGSSGASFGQAALHIASANNDLDVMKILVSQGADIHLQTDAGKSPLGYAIERCHYEATSILADLRASAYRGSYQGRGWIEYAAEHCSDSRIYQKLESINP